MSAKNLATDGNGIATFVYKAPEAVDSADRNTMVTIKVTPQSGDARGDIARTIQIRLVPAGTVSGGLAQVPDFTVSPSAPKQLESVVFDASDPTLDATLVGYSWDFGDGSSGTGPDGLAPVPGRGHVLCHADRNRHRRLEGLAVEDGRRRHVRRPGGRLRLLAERPRASVRQIVFNGASSTAVSPRTIVSYDWQFGTGRTGSGMIVSQDVRHAGHLQRDAHGHR